MPNNGIISRQAVIPDEFLVESADPTDLVIINTPTTGNKVQQKAVPVSALGGGGTLPYYSFVYKLHLLLDLSDASETVYNSFPEDYDLFVDVIPGTNSGDAAIVEIIDNNNVLEFTKVSVVIDSCLSPRIYIDEKNSTNVIIRLNNGSSGGKGAQLLIDQYVLFEIKYYY
jgi:hypothetical protein